MKTDISYKGRIDFEKIRTTDYNNQLEIDLDNIWKCNKDSPEVFFNLFDGLVQKINLEDDLITAADFILQIAIKYLFTFEFCAKKIENLLYLNFLQGD